MPAIPGSGLPVGGLGRGIPGRFGALPVAGGMPGRFETPGRCDPLELPPERFGPTPGGFDFAFAPAGMVAPGGSGERPGGGSLGGFVRANGFTGSSSANRDAPSCIQFELPGASCGGRMRGELP